VKKTIGAGVLDLTQMAGIVAILGKLGVLYLIYDTYTTDESAPITSPRVTEPGGQSVTHTDPGNRMNLSGGDWVCSTPSGILETIYFRSVSVFARAAGLALYSKTSFMGNDPNSYHGLGHSLADHYVRMAESDQLNTDKAGSVNVAVDSIPNEVLHEFYCIYRDSSGAFSLVRKNGELDWILGFVNYHNNDVSLSLQNTLYRPRGDLGTCYQEFWFATQLRSPWKDETEIDTDRISGSLSGSETFTHEADCLVEFVVDTLPS
jgi:hypothetical protein